MRLLAHILWVPRALLTNITPLASRPPWILHFNHDNSRCELSSQDTWAGIETLLVSYGIILMCPVRQEPHWPHFPDEQTEARSQEGPHPGLHS